MANLKKLVFLDPLLMNCRPHNIITFLKANWNNLTKNNTSRKSQKASPE